jgi:hypothetical protein
MPQVVKPHSVIIQTKEGEVSVKLTIDLNLNLNGEINAVTASAKTAPAAEVAKPSEEPEWMIPDFSASENIDFGKYEK